MSSYIRRAAQTVAAVVCAAAVCTSSWAAPIDTSARAAILVDVSTDTVLLAKNADERLPPASMSKLMTVLMVLEAVDSGRLSLADTAVVSEKAWRERGGSVMWVEVDDQISIEDLLRGVIISSGNDASIVLAEHLGGTEERFAQQMNARARELGLENSHFVNSHGLPNDEHYMSVRDIAAVGLRMLTHHASHYGYFSEESFAWGKDRAGRPITQQNRNPLLGLDRGVDGLKTGHTDEAGYGIVASAERDGRRLLLVVSGLNTARARAQESQRILDWGFRMFETVTLAPAGSQLGEADVWIGAASTVPLVVNEDVVMSIPGDARDQVTAEIVYLGPIEAPISAGDEIGVLRVAVPDLEPVSRPVYAGVDVPRGGFVSRARAAAVNLTREAFALIKTDDSEETEDE